MAEIRRRFPEAWAARGEALDTFRPPGGESFQDLAQRVMPAFRQLSESPDGPILVAGHAGVNRVILCRLLGMPLRNLFRLSQDYAGLTRIDASVRPLRVKCVNCLPGSLTTGGSGRA
jgi:probable phosphoglycerate mutase